MKTKTGRMSLQNFLVQKKGFSLQSLLVLLLKKIGVRHLGLLPVSWQRRAGVAAHPVRWEKVANLQQPRRTGGPGWGPRPPHRGAPPVRQPWPGLPRRQKGEQRMGAFERTASGRTVKRSNTGEKALRFVKFLIGPWTRAGCYWLSSPSVPPAPRCGHGCSPTPAVSRAMPSNDGRGGDASPIGSRLGP